jgi:hypothetical protein
MHLEIAIQFILTGCHSSAMPDLAATFHILAPQAAIGS